MSVCVCVCVGVCVCVNMCACVFAYVAEEYTEPVILQSHTCTTCAVQ